MGTASENRFPFSDTCYFDIASGTIVDLDDGKVTQYTPLSATESAVLENLIQAYPGSISKELLCPVINADCDESEVRRIINKLKKRHEQLNAWIPRARQGAYRLLAPATPVQSQPSVPPSPQEFACSLKNTGICVRPNFVKEARSDIFDQLDAAFAQSHVVFLQGIGGIGKSETAKHWALQKKKERLFDTVVFAQLNAEASNSNVQSLIADDTVFVISGAFRSRDEDESVEAYFRRKLAKIKQITDQRTLIIIDNYDIDDPQMAQLFTGTYRVLVTTRNKQAGFDFPLISVTEIREPEHLKEIFFKNLGEERDDIQRDDPYIEKLFEVVSNHTLTVEIIAKSLVNTTDTPQSIYQKIGDPHRHVLMGHIDGVVERNFSEEPLSPFECIRLLFSLSRLEQDRDFEYKSQVLVFMAATPTRGIELSLFKKWSDSHIIRAKNSLVQKSWLRQDTVKGVTLISMHPLIRELVWYDLEPSLEKCSTIIKGFIQDQEGNIDFLYHFPKYTKDEYERIAVSFLSAFPVQDLTNLDFYIKLQGILYSCRNTNGSLILIKKLKVLLERENQTESWKYAFIIQRMASIYCSLYLDGKKAISLFLEAEKRMLSTANTAYEQLILAIVYREMAVAALRIPNQLTDGNQIPADTIEEWLNKGNKIVSNLRKSGMSNRHLDLYLGLSHLWQSRLEISRGNLDIAVQLIDTAESEFLRYGYVNALDRWEVADVRARIFAVKGEYNQEIKYLTASIQGYISGFGEYNYSALGRAVRLAIAYQNNSQPAEAIDVLTHYQKIAEEMLGEDAPLTVTIRSMLTQLHQTADSGN